MSRQLNVLVAHHEKLIVDTLLMILKQVNVNAVGAYSGGTALETVFSTNLDVAILCIVPTFSGDINGVYAAVVVRALKPACRILLFPGGSGPWVIDPLNLALSHGHEFEVIPEPIHPDDLFALLTQSTGGEIEPIRRKSTPEAEPGHDDRSTTEPRQASPRFALDPPTCGIRSLFRKLAGRE